MDAHFQQVCTPPFLKILFNVNLLYGKNMCYCKHCICYYSILSILSKHVTIDYKAGIISSQLKFLY